MAEESDYFMVAWKEKKEGGKGEREGERVPEYNLQEHTVYFNSAWALKFPQPADSEGNWGLGLCGNLA